MSYEVNLDKILEKCANISPMTNKQFEALKYVFEKRAYEKNKAYFEKLAAEEDKEIKETSRKDLNNAKKIAEFRFDEISTIKNGETIVFPEMNDSGNEISMVSALVLTDFDTTKFSKQIKVPKRIILASDGRVKIMYNEESFLCKKADVNFKIKLTDIHTLKDGDSFFSIIGDKVLAPVKVGYVYNMLLSHKDTSSPMNVGSVLEIKPFKDYDMFNKSDYSNNIAILPEKKFDKVTLDDFVSLKSKEVKLPEDIIESLLPYSIKQAKTFLASDKNTKVIKIAGNIFNNFKSQNEFDLKRNNIDAGITDKKAFTINTISLFCIDRKMKKYNLVVDYKDTDERLLNLRTQKFNNITESKVRAILRILKFQGNKINEIIYKSRNEPRATYTIPSECTMEDVKKLMGGDQINVSTQAIKNTFNKYINPFEIASSLAAATAGTAIAKSGAAFIKNNPNAAVNGFGKAIKFVNKFAEESKITSVGFEKLAQERRDDVLLDYAKALAIGHYFGEKVATVLSDTDNIYPDIKSAANEIIKAKPVLEKFAYDLTKQKVNQDAFSREDIDTTLLKKAVECFDNLYKTAYSVATSCREDKLNFDELI